MVFKVPTDSTTGFGDPPTLGEGGGGNPPQGFVPPIAAENVKVVVKATGVTPSFQVTWTDEQVKPPSRKTVDVWQIRFTSEKTAGTSNGEPDWAIKVLGLSRYLNSITSGGAGSVLTYTHTELNMPDGYVIIIGLNTTFLIAGPPSQPWLIRLQSSSLTLADDVTDQSVQLFVETFNGAEYFNFTPTFRSPSNAGVFKGVQIYWSIYADGIGKTEMGNMDIFVGTTGGYLQVSPYRRYPLSDIVTDGRGFLTTTSGSPNVVWASGTNFVAPWVGQHVYIQWDGGYNGFPGGWTPDIIGGFTDGTHMALSSNAPQNGTFPFFVLAPTTVYFVSVSNYGIRGVVDTSPAVFF